MRYFTHMLVAVLILVMVTAVACTKTTPQQTGGQTQDQTTGSDTTGTPDNSGATSTPDGTTSTPDGTTSTPPDSAGFGSTLLTTTLPPEWPSDVPIMEGLTIFTSSVQRPTGAIITMVGAHGVVDLDALQEYYMALEGWDEDHRVEWITTGDQQRFLKFKRGGNEDLSLDAKKEGEMVSVMFLHSITGG